MYIYIYMSDYNCVYIQLYLFVYSDYTSVYTNFFFVCNILHLIKFCVCCFVDIHLYSNILSTIATISSLIKLELLTACSFCNNNFNPSQSALGSDDIKYFMWNTRSRNC